MGKAGQTPAAPFPGSDPGRRFTYFSGSDPGRGVSGVRPRSSIYTLPRVSLHCPASFSAELGYPFNR
jgi:hypothetical protein